MIVSHDASRLHRIGVQSATFRIAGNGSGNHSVPITPPFRVRGFKFVTDDNTGVGSLTAQPQNAIGGDNLCAAANLFLGTNSVVTVAESAIDADLANISTSFDGLNFEVTAGVAGAWGFHVEVLISAQLDSNALVCLDPQVEGLQ